MFDGKNGNAATQPGCMASRLLSERQVAELLNISEVTLQEWGSQHKGPPFVRLGTRMIRYREADIELWLVEMEVRPHSRLVGPGHAVLQYSRRYERLEPESASAKQPASVEQVVEDDENAHVENAGEHGDEQRLRSAVEGDQSSHATLESVPGER